MTISLYEAQNRIAQEKTAVEEAFKRWGYQYYGRFSEEPSISFWVKEDKEGVCQYELQGRYQVPAPCIDIGEDFFWQYEDENGDINDKNSGTGADELSKFLVDNQ